MTIRNYNWQDTGAPLVSGSADLVVALRTVLLGCLVNGYGSKPAAGWAVGHDVAGGFSLSNGDGIVAFVASSATNVIVYVMESITDGTTALPAGTNRRSGPWYDGGTSSQRHYLYCDGAASTSQWFWTVTADSKTVHVSLYRANAGGTAWGGGLTFGKYLNVNGLTGPASFCAMGGNLTTNGLFAFGIGGGSATYHGTLLRNPFTGLIDQGVTPQVGPVVPSISYGTAGPINRVNMYLDVVVPVSAVVMCYGAGLSGGTDPSAACYAGRLRGIESDPVLASMSYANITAMLGLTGDAKLVRTMPFALPNGKQWVPFMLGFNGAFSGFVSLSEADWS